MKYICRVKGCNEDLTEEVKEIIVENAARIAAMSVKEKEPLGEDKRRIYVICSKGHKNVFEV